MKQFLDTYKTLIITIIVVLACLTVIRQCEKEPKVITKTVTKTVTKRDTIIKTVISKPKTVYVNKYVNVKGETEIVYVKLPDSSTIKANQYNTTLNSNKANAELKITTTGELLDVSGVITYPKEIVTNTITKTSAKSGLFLYGSAPLNTNNISVEVGLMYQLKNTLGIIGGLQYNDFTKSVDAKVGLAVKIF